jgi:nitroreductase
MKNNNSVLDNIYTRRSIRQFTDRPVPDDMLVEILRAGSWAPSGLNNQPWRFAIITDLKIKKKFEAFTKYNKVIASAMALLPVFIDKDAMYNEVKDHQSIGACLQNMLLAAHSMGLGAVWLGEIIKSSKETIKLLELPDRLELMAVVAVGYPADSGRTPVRKPLDELIVYKR